MSDDLSKIVESCRFLLQQYPAAQECQEYLDARLSKDSQELFQFGYFPGTENISALISIIGEDVLIKNKLLYNKEIEDSLGPRSISSIFFEDYPLIMPYKDAYGNIVALVGRSLLSDSERDKQKISKYKNTIFSKGNYLYGLFENKENIIEKDYVYIVEGQIDVIKSRERGLYNMVALGNFNMSSYQFSVINRYTNNIFLLLDNDDAGLKGRKLIMNKFGRFANICNFYVPDNYKDIDEYLTKENIYNYEDMSFVIRD